MAGLEAEGRGSAASDNIGTLKYQFARGQGALVVAYFTNHLPDGQIQALSLTREQAMSLFQKNRCGTTEDTRENVRHRLANVQELFLALAAITTVSGNKSRTGTKRDVPPPPPARSNDFRL